MYCAEIMRGFPKLLYQNRLIFQFSFSRNFLKYLVLLVNILLYLWQSLKPLRSCSFIQLPWCSPFFLCVLSWLLDSTVNHSHSLHILHSLACLALSQLSQTPPLVKSNSSLSEAPMQMNVARGNHTPLIPCLSEVHGHRRDSSVALGVPDDSFTLSPPSLNSYHIFPILTLSWTLCLLLS